MAGIRRLDVTVGQAGTEAAMLQLNRTPAAQPEVTVGHAGASAAMLQLNR